MGKFQLYKGLAVTSSDILGPFYRPGSPFRTKLADEPNLFLSGAVRDTEGNLISCYVDFWQANKDGQYDEDGPTFRGIQHAPEGKYTLETIKPGYYDISEPTDPQPHDFRCSHIHVKIWVHGKDVLTTQLYFTDSPYDNTDHWFSKDRCIKFTDAQHGTFDFVVN